MLLMWETVYHSSMSNENIVTIPMKMFHHDITCFIGSTPIEMGEYFDKRAKPVTKSWKEELTSWDWSHCSGKTFDNTGQPCIWIKSKPNTPYTIAVLAHEALHAMSFLAIKIGMEFDPDKSEEFYSYGTGYIVEKVLDHVKKFDKIK